MEGKIIAQAITRLAQGDSFGQHALRRLLASMRDFKQIIDGGFCHPPLPALTSPILHLVLVDLDLDLDLNRALLLASHAW